MFGDSAGNYCEVLTPVQGVKTPDPAPTLCGGAHAPSRLHHQDDFIQIAM